MPVKTIRLNDYRNYRRHFFEFDPHLNIIVGKNGTGKTNILESIIVVSNTKSYRTNNDADLIRKGFDFARIILNTPDKEYKVVINKKNKSLYINDVLVKRTSQFIGEVNAILFKPSDLELFTQSPGERRKLLDIELSKVSKPYIQSLLRYNSLLKDKNKLLKELEIDELLLNVIDESMAPMIKIILSERNNFFTIANRYISDYYKLISGKDSRISIVYKKCCEIENVEDKITEAKEKDRYYHYTTFGPHHDDYSFFMDGYELNSIASQGQKRMVLIAFKFALMRYIEYMTNVTPIVLLDDILSELDKENQERLLNIIPDDTQVIITNTDINNLNIAKNYKLIELKEEQDV
ncbi:MAG: DNA replication and repair protein RecF [Erysipelotrichaceae bacterium]|nr:DNA replication and repair protein RecF [Erysipelotrichaceae bacterium]